jgi:hypothetical protein
MPSQVSSLPKRAAEDTTLTVNNADGGKTTFPVPAGTDIVFHAPGLHYNRILNLFLFYLKDWSLLKSHSDVLEGSLYLPATEVP